MVIVLLILLLCPVVAGAGQPPQHINSLPKLTYPAGTITSPAFNLAPVNRLSFTVDIDTTPGAAIVITLRISTDKVNWRTFLQCNFTASPYPVNKAPTGCTGGFLNIPQNAQGMVTIVSTAQATFGITLDQ